MEAIKLKDESGSIIDGYELIVNAPYIMKDAGSYLVTFVNIVSGTGAGGEGFVFNEADRSIIYISALDEQSNAIQVVIEKKDATIANPFPVDLLKEYDGTDFMLFSAQYYLQGFTEVISEGETSPLSIRFIFQQGNINTVTDALLVADLIFAGDPDSVIPYNYNLIGITEFLGSIVPRTVTINIPFNVGELPYTYCSKEYDGNALFIKEVTLNNVLTHLDPDIDVVGMYYDNYEAVTSSRHVGDNKVLRFILLNDYHSNYRIVETQETYLTQIYKRSITIINENLDKEYDGSVYMSEAQLADIVFDRMITGDNLYVAFAIYTDKNVGYDKHIGLTLGGTDSINYELLTLEGELHYAGDITPKEITVIGTITKNYDKNDLVDTETLTLYEICEGDAVLFAGVYSGGQFTVCENHPILFTLSGTDAANYLLIGDYYGEITPLPITVNGTISKVYDKTDTVTVATLSLSYNLDGADLTFSGVYDGSHVDAGNNLPVVFTLSGSASPNYLLTGDYYGTILRRAVAILITGEITKVYDKTSNVIFEAPNNAVLDSQNIDGEDLSFYGNYANNHQDVTPSSPVVFTLTGTAAPNYMVEGSYTGSITPKLITVTYTETSQSYRSPVVDVGAVVNTNDIVEGDSVTATVDMSGVAQTHNRFTRYSGLLAVSDNPNYYVDASNDTDLYFRYFYLADGETSIFRIESIDDLDMLNSKDFFHDYLTLDYLLVNDIDNGKKVFSMIEGEYSGDFDGNGKVLSGLVLLHVGSEATDANPARLALFEALAAEGSIRNLKVVNTSLNNYDNHTITAGLVAYHEGSIINCVFEGEIYAGTQTSLSAITGGIAGISLGSIQNSSAVAIIVAESANAYTGGIAGKLEGQAAVADSVGFVEITATAATTAISGGVIGQNDSQALQSGNTYLADASLINGVILTKAIGNDTDETGENYGAIALDNPTLASVVSLYRIGSYAPCQGTPNQPIVINNYRQMVLLSQFRWASFTLNADIAFPTAYVHTPEKGVFCGTLSNGSGSSYTITLPPATPLIYKKLFNHETAGAIMVTVA